MDRGMVSEKNLEFMRAVRGHGIWSVPPSPCSKSSNITFWIKTGKRWSPASKSNSALHRWNGETFVLCRSPGRKEKENAILNRFVARLEDKLTKLAERATQGKLKDRQKVERQIGRLLERNSRAASLFTVAVTEKNARVSIDIKRNEERYEQALETGGSYILRTNWKETDPKTLWETYIQLTEVEDAFRTAKHDLGHAADLSSEEREDPGAYPRLLSLPGVMADSAAMDEGVRPRHCAEKAAGRDEGDQIPRCPLTCTGQNHQAQGRGHRLTATQGLASTDENPPPQQTEDDRKCSGEKHPSLVITPVQLLILKSATAEDGLGFSPTHDYETKSKPRTSIHKMLASFWRAVAVGLAGVIAVLPRHHELSVLFGLRLGLAAGTVSALVGLFSPVVEWWIENLPERRLGVFGVVLILLGVMFQSIEHWLVVFGPPVH